MAFSPKERILQARDALLSSPSFQRWASGFLLTKPVARVRARQVFDLCAGFVYSQVLFACVKLGLLERVRAGPQTFAELSEGSGMSAERFRLLLDAAASLGILSRRGAGRFGLGPHGAAIIANPGILRMVEHHEMLYRDLADPLALLRSERVETELSRYWPYAIADDRSKLSASDVGPYTALMSSSQALVADEILDGVPLGNYRSLLDVGGGDGTFLERVGQRYPEIELSLFDLPAVAERARERFARAGMGSRARVTGGDFTRDQLPGPVDAVTLVRVLHDHSDDVAKKIIGGARKALASGGALIIAEPLAGTRGAQAMGHAYFAFYLMAMGSGRPRTPDEIKSLLEGQGFQSVRQLATRIPLQAGVIIANSRPINVQSA